jgi:hypothetical protein
LEKGRAKKRASGILLRNGHRGLGEFHLSLLPVYGNCQGCGISFPDRSDVKNEEISLLSGDIRNDAT